MVTAQYVRPVTNDTGGEADSCLHSITAYAREDPLQTRTVNMGKDKKKEKKEVKKVESEEDSEEEVESEEVSECVCMWLPIKVDFALSTLAIGILFTCVTARSASGASPVRWSARWSCASWVYV